MSLPLMIVMISIMIQIAIILIVLKFNSPLTCPHCEKKMGVTTAWKAKRGVAKCEHCQEVCYIRSNTAVNLLIPLPLLFNVIYQMLEVPRKVMFSSFFITFFLIVILILPYGYKALKEDKPLW